MNKLTMEEAQDLVNKAWQQTNPIYRYGQALYNLLPGNIKEALVFTEMDFFHEEDFNVVNEKFFKYCVEV
jgi:hypothetical protein